MFRPIQTTGIAIVASALALACTPPATAQVTRGGQVNREVQRQRLPSLRRPTFNLPDGAQLHFDGREIQLSYTHTFVYPPNDVSRRVKWDVTEVRGANGVILQVSRSPFSLDLDPNNTPPGIASQMRLDGKSGVSDLAIAAIAKEAGYEVPTSNPTVRGQGNAGRVRDASFMARSGQFSLYVRVVPIASMQNPIPVGKASQQLQITYGKQPPMDFKIEPWKPKPKEPPPVQCLQLVYTPANYYCYVHPNPSVCAKVGQSKKWYEEIVDAVTEVWDWAAETYSDAKNTVVNIASAALPFVPKEAFSYALDSALVACGIPPNIPNLDQMMSYGADYLAEEMVTQLGPPVAGDLAKEQIKKALLAGAKAAAKKVGNAGPDTQCAYTIDFPFLMMLVKNTSDKPLADIYFGAFDTTSMFMSYRVHIPVIKPGHVLPVGFPIMPNFYQKKYIVQGVLKDNYWWGDYNTEKDSIQVYASDDKLVAGQPFGATTGLRMFNVGFTVKK